MRKTVYKDYLMKPMMYVVGKLPAPKNKIVRRIFIVCLGVSNLFTWPLQIIDSAINFIKEDYQALIEENKKDISFIKSYAPIYWNND